MNQSSTDDPQGNRFAASFEGRLDIVDVDGHLAVLAQGLGRLLGYADDGKQLVGLISKEWASEFVAEGDVIVIRGDRLASFKAACKALGLDLVDKRAPSLMLLTMSGVQLVLARSEKPEGKTFRRWLVSEVIPAYERGRRLEAAEAPQLAGTAPAAGAGGRGGKPPRGARGTRALPDGDRPAAIPVNADETVEERLAAADHFGQQLPRVATDDELRRGQILRLVRASGERSSLLLELQRLAGRPPAVKGHRERWEVELTQAIWMVRRLSAEMLVIARETVGRIVLARGRRPSEMAGHLLGMITLEMATLPEGVLAEVLVAVPRWRSGIERPIPLPVPMAG
jgi:prophage antirepressor-like protein